MRTRNKKMSDYGVPKEDEQKVWILCQKQEYSDILRNAVLSSVPHGLEEPIYDGLSKGQGYSTIGKSQEIYAKRDDFYAYKRRAAAEFYHFMRLMGKWRYE